MSDALRDALAEALLMNMHTVGPTYELAGRLLAHPAVLAALSERYAEGYRDAMAGRRRAALDRSDPAVGLRDEDLCSKPVIDWSRGETPTYDTDGRCTICGTRFVVRRQKGVAPPTYVSCPNCECSEFSWRTYSELADAPTASPTDRELMAYLAGKDAVLDRSDPAVGLREAVDKFVFRHDNSFTGQPWCDGKCVEVADLRVLAVLDRSDPAVGLREDHCPACSGTVSTYSGQGEGYDCPGLATTLASPTEDWEDSDA